MKSAGVITVSNTQLKRTLDIQHILGMVTQVRIIPFYPGFEIVKYECADHIQKRVGSQCRNLK